LSAVKRTVSHPTQGLLDALTILQAKQKFDGPEGGIVGDVKASRASRAPRGTCCTTLGVGEIRIVAADGADAEPANSSTARGSLRIDSRHRRASTSS
jgi:hypothetical protein